MAFFSFFLLLKMCWNTYFYSVFWTSTKNCQKNGQKKTITFDILQNTGWYKKNRFVATPLLTKNVFFKFFVLKPKTFMLNRKHNLKSGKSKDKKKELETKKGRKLKKEKWFQKKKTCNLIFWCCSFHERKAKKKEKERKKETKTRNQKKAKNKDQKEERKKRRKKRDRERETGKAGGSKQAKGERKRNTENKQKMPFSGAKTRFFLY